MIRRPPRSPLFPSTPLFRSLRGPPGARAARSVVLPRRPERRGAPPLRGPPAERRHRPERSEEHTSELQSPCNLVCRLLLEKKKNKIHITRSPLKTRDHIE